MGVDGRRTVRTVLAVGEVGGGPLELDGGIGRQMMNETGVQMGRIPRNIPPIEIGTIPRTVTAMVTLSGLVTEAVGGRKVVGGAVTLNPILISMVVITMATKEERGGGLEDTDNLKITNRRGVNIPEGGRQVGVAVVTMEGTRIGATTRNTKPAGMQWKGRRTLLGDYREGCPSSPRPRNPNAGTWTSLITQPLPLGTSRRWRSGRRGKIKLPLFVRSLWRMEKEGS